MLHTEMLVVFALYDSKELTILRGGMVEVEACRAVVDAIDAGEAVSEEARVVFEPSEVRAAELA